MTLGGRIRASREKAGITQEELGKACNVTKQTIFKYENDIITNIPLDKLKAISIYLDVSPAYLMDWETEDGGYDIGIAQIETGLSEDEIIRFVESKGILYKGNTLFVSDEAMALAADYDHRMDDWGRKAVRELADIEIARFVDENRRAIQDEVEDPEDNVTYFPLRCSTQSASAGTGTYLGPEAFETIYVQENALTRRATFGVPVSGDSMEPRYHNGDILMVEGAEELDVGEIGVFSVDGEGFVKQLGDGELISLNPKYAPVPLTESTWCHGRVIGVLAQEWIAE